MVLLMSAKVVVDDVGQHPYPQCTRPAAIRMVLSLVRVAIIDTLHVKQAEAEVAGGRYPH